MAPFTCASTPRACCLLRASGKPAARATAIAAGNQHPTGPGASHAGAEDTLAVPEQIEWTRGLNLGMTLNSDMGTQDQLTTNLGCKHHFRTRAITCISSAECRFIGYAQPAGSRAPKGGAAPAGRI